MDAYMGSGDPLAKYLGHVGSVGERWLRDSPAKRMIAWDLYGDLLASTGKWVLDVGACSSSLTRKFRSDHDYTVCDLGEHDGRVGVDWRDLPVAVYDLIIANDLFPNVDQGLRAFLYRFYGNGELRMSLTTYADRWYRARRVGADELLTVQAWDWPQTRRELEALGIPGCDVRPPSESLFPNGRQVALLRC